MRPFFFTSNIMNRFLYVPPQQFRLSVVRSRTDKNLFMMIDTIIDVSNNICGRIQRHQG